MLIFFHQIVGQLYTQFNRNYLKISSKNMQSFPKNYKPTLSLEIFTTFSSNREEKSGKFSRNTLSFFPLEKWQEVCDVASRDTRKYLQFPHRYAVGLIVINKGIKSIPMSLRLYNFFSCKCKMIIESRFIFTPNEL